MKKLSHCSFITLLVLMVIGLGFLSTPASAHYEMQFPAITAHGFCSWLYGLSTTI